MTFSLHSQLLRLNDEIKKVFKSSPTDKNWQHQRAHVSNISWQFQSASIKSRFYEFQFYPILLIFRFLSILCDVVNFSPFFSILFDFLILVSRYRRFQSCFSVSFFQLKSAVNRCNSYFIVSATFTGSAFWMLFENHENFNIWMETSNVILSHNYSK